MRTWVVCLVLLLSCHGAGAAEVFGAVDAVSGSASVSGQDGETAAVSVGMKIYAGDTISSAHDGEVHIVTDDGGIIALRPDTVFRVDEYKAEGGSSDRTFMSLLKGAVRSVTGWIGKHDSSAYRITTPTATIGVRGTDHEVAVIEKGDGDEPGTYDTVNEGATVMKTPKGEAEVAPGKFAFAPKAGGAAPRLLAQRPHFFAARALRLEDRILQHKEHMRGRFEQMREERIKQYQQARGEPGGGNAAPERIGGADRRSDPREERHESLRRQREEYRERRQAREPGALSSEQEHPYRRRERKHPARDRE